MTLIAIGADQAIAPHGSHPPQPCESHPGAMLADKDLPLERV
ncbi:hypothetical protein [Neorhizobium alkalisoli]|nr:hypothetical protein [Neorhizobium alkalisoli]